MKQTLPDKLTRKETECRERLHIKGRNERVNRENEYEETQEGVRAERCQKEKRNVREGREIIEGKINWNKKR